MNKSMNFEIKSNISFLNFFKNSIKRQFLWGKNNEASQIHWKEGVSYTLLFKLLYN